MQIVLIFKKYTQCIQSKQKERVNTQKLAIAPTNNLASSQNLTT